LKILNDPRLIGEYPRRGQIKRNGQLGYRWRCAVRPAHDSSFRHRPDDPPRL